MNGFDALLAPFPSAIRNRKSEMPQFFFVFWCLCGSPSFPIRNPKSVSTWAFFTTSRFDLSLFPSRDYLWNPLCEKARKGPVFRDRVFLHVAARYPLSPPCPPCLSWFLSSAFILVHLRFLLPLRDLRAFARGHPNSLCAVRGSFFLPRFACRPHPMRCTVLSGGAHVFGFVAQSGTGVSAFLPHTKRPSRLRSHGQTCDAEQELVSQIIRSTTNTRRI